MTIDLAKFDTEWADAYDPTSTLDYAAARRRADEMEAEIKALIRARFGKARRRDTALRVTKLALLAAVNQSDGSISKFRADMTDRASETRTYTEVQREIVRLYAGAFLFWLILEGTLI